MPSACVMTGALPLAMLLALAHGKADMPLSSMPWVQVAFGLAPRSDGVLPSDKSQKRKWALVGKNFSEIFAQISLWQFCNDLPADLLVVHSSCWIKNFRSHQFQNQEAFPVRQLGKKVSEFALSSNLSCTEDVLQNCSVEDFLWISRAGSSTSPYSREIQASYMTFWVNVEPGASSQVKEEYMRKWHNYVAGYDADGALVNWFGAAWITSELTSQSNSKSVDLSCSSCNAPWIAMILAVVYALLF